MTERILVIRLGQLGDVILCSSLALNLKLNFPSSRIDFLTRSQFAPIARLMPGVDRVITFDDHGSVAELYRLTHSLSEQRYGTVVDLQRKLKSWFVKKLAQPEQSYIYPKRRWERKRAVSRRNKKIPEHWPHTIDLYNEIVTQMGGEILVTRPQLRLESPLQENCNNHLRIFLAPGASYKNKNWGLERFVKVGQQLIEEHNAELYIALQAQDAEPFRVFDQDNGGGGRLLIDRSYEELMQVMSTCDAALSNDSGLMHLASAVGLPVIGLFGPTHPCLGFEPRGLFSSVKQATLPCRPCSLHGKKACFQPSQYCFDQITVDDVVDDLSDLAAHRHTRQPALFVDRDGTVIVEKEFLSDPEQVELIPGAAEALRMAVSAGYKPVLISNQSGVARGLFGRAEVERVNERVQQLLSKQGVALDAIYYCPYYKNGTVTEFALDHDWRKPKPGMAETAAIDHNLDLNRSIVVGDKLDDYRLGQVIGGRSALVLTGYGKRQMEQSGGAVDEKTVFNNLLEAVQAIVKTTS